MRDRDFLPEKTTDNLKAGGANNFVAFFKNELIPYINKKLPATGDNSLFGHSLGGRVYNVCSYLKSPVCLQITIVPILHSPGITDA